MTHLRPAPASVRPTVPRGKLLVLTASGFLTIILETIPAGILPQMSEDLGVSESAAGQTVSVYALGAIVGAIPVISATMGWPRRRLLVGSLAAYIVTSLIVAISPSFAVTLGARFVAGVFAGVVWGIIAGIAGRVVAPGHHGRALTIAFAGTPIALAVGVPSGALIAGVIGWRLTFVAMAVFAAVIIVWAQVALPSMPGQDMPERIPVRRVFTVPGLVPVLITSVLYVTAHNLLYTYLAPLLALSGIGDAVSAVLLLFGVASLVRLAVTGALIDRHLRSLMLVSTAAFAAATLSLALMPFSSVAVFVSAAAWGLAFGGAASLLQTAMMTAAGTAVDAAQAVLVTGWNLGIAGGGVFGGVLLSATGPGSLAWVTLALLTAALILVIAGRFHAFPPPTTAHPPHL